MVSVMVILVSLFGPTSYKYQFRFQIMPSSMFQVDFYGPMLLDGFFPSIYVFLCVCVGFVYCFGFGYGFGEH